MQTVLSKAELRDVIRRFLEDPNRGISHNLFADVAGIDVKTLQRVFLTEEYPLTENVQRRVSRAYGRYVKGELMVMKNEDRTRFVTFRKDPKPVFAKTNRVVFENGSFKVFCGIENRRDYSKPSIDDQLSRG